MDPDNRSQQFTRFAVLILSVGLASAAIQYLFSDRSDFSDFDLGTATSSVFAEADGIPIHFSVPSAEAEATMLSDLDQHKKPALLILGNSQTHSVNRFKAGEATLVGLLHNSLPDFYVFAQTLPNANLQELYVSYLHWMDRCGPQMVVLPVFFDDMREDNLRHDLASYSHVLPELKQANAIGENLAAQLTAIQPNDVKVDSEDALVPNTHVSLQDRSEKYLDETLSTQLPIWRKRPAVRGEIFLTLYLLRNTILGLSSQSKRPVLPGPLNRNMQALEEILKHAQAHKTKVLLYFPPLRQDVAPPYDMDAYKVFKQKISEMAQPYDCVSLSDLDSIIPGELWGMKESTNLSRKPEYDFMHFRFEGHSILAKALKEQIEKLRVTP